MDSERNVRADDAGYGPNFMTGRSPLGSFLSAAGTVEATALSPLVDGVTSACAGTGVGCGTGSGTATGVGVSCAGSTSSFFFLATTVSPFGSGCGRLFRAARGEGASSRAVTPQP